MSRPLKRPTRSVIQREKIQNQRQVQLQIDSFNLGTYSWVGRGLAQGRVSLVSVSVPTLELMLP
jgi:hypothetical protein